MQTFLDYINAIPQGDRDEFAKRCGTSIGYLRKAISVKQRLREDVCVAIERESKGAIRCEDLRPDLEWKRTRDGIFWATKASA